MVLRSDIPLTESELTAGEDLSDNASELVGLPSISAGVGAGAGAGAVAVGVVFVMCVSGRGARKE